MNIDDLTIGDIKQLQGLVGGGSNNLQPFKIGKAYLIRTVTHIDIGIIEAVGDKELVLSSASWIADTGRFHQCVSEGKLSEVEPYVNEVILGRGAIIDATEWTHDIPKEQR